MKLINDLEIALMQARQGSLPLESFLKVFVASTLSLVTLGDGDDADAFARPLLLDTPKGRMVACFTDPVRIGDFGALAGTCIGTTGAELVHLLGRGHGVAVNPGTSLAFEITAEGVAQLARVLPRLVTSDA